MVKDSQPAALASAPRTAALDDQPRRPAQPGDTFADVAARALTRRALVARLAGASFVAYLPRVGTWSTGPGPVGSAALSFAPIPGSTADRIEVAAGHRAEVLLRWGDPVLAGAPPFDPQRLDAAAQARQFGYNADFVGFMPLPLGARGSDRGLLVVNHEYTNPELMFPAYDPVAPTPEQVAVQLAAHGM